MPVVVLIFRDARTYEPFMPRNNGRVVRVGGFFQSGQDVNYITLNVQAGREGFRVVFHEYAHLLLPVLLIRTPNGVLRARNLSDVLFISHRRGVLSAVGCGALERPVEAYLTWRAVPNATTADEGTAVAVELLPEGFVP